METLARFLTKSIENHFSLILVSLSAGLKNSVINLFIE